MKNIFRVIAFVTFSLLISGVLTLSILEIYLRISTNPIESLPLQTHPQRRYALKPLARGRTVSVKFKINSLGLRDYERPILGDAYKIAIFGDSITFGTGVEREKTFAKLLESKLNVIYKNKLPTPIQVFNFGVPGYATVQEYRYIKESYSTFKPNMIIFEFTAENDTRVLTDAASGVNKYRILRDLKDMLRHLYSYNFLAVKFYGFLYQWKVREYKDTGKDTSEEKFYFDNIYNLYYREDYQGWIEAKKAFSDLKLFCDKNNTTLIFAIFANNFKVSPVPEEDLMYPITKKVKTVLQDIGVEHILIMDDTFRNYAGKERLLWVTPTNRHFSELAHKLVAEQIFEYIDEHNLIVR